LNISPVKVDIEQLGEQLRDTSRINIVKEYRVEHNTHVRLVGKVVDEHWEGFFKSYLKAQKFA
jgi:hypothetical protein